MHMRTARAAWGCQHHVIGLCRFFMVLQVEVGALQTLYLFTISAIKYFSHGSIREINFMCGREELMKKGAKAERSLEAETDQ